MDKHFPNLSNVQLRKKSFTPMPETTLPTQLTIGEAATRLGVSHKTLRRWEKYGLVHPIRNSQNQRLYHAAEIDNLSNRKYKPLPESNIAPENYLSISEAADEIGVSIKTLRRWDADGRINLSRDQHNRRIFTRDDINALKNNRPEAVAPAPPATASSDQTLKPSTQDGAGPAAKLPVKPTSIPSPYLPPLAAAFIAPFLSLLPFILVALPLIIFAVLGYKPSVPIQKVSFPASPSPLPLGMAPLEPSTATESAISRDNPIFHRPATGEVAGITVTGGSLISFERLLDNNYNFGVAGIVEGNQLIATTTVKPPLVISSRERVTNLNAELLDGHTWEEIVDAANSTIPLQTAYNAGNAINTSGKDIVFTLTGTDKFVVDGHGDVRIATSGKTIISGLAELNAGLSVKGGSLTVGTDRFTVSPTTGDTAIAGTLSVTGTVNASTLQSAANLVLRANNNNDRHLYVQTTSNNPSLFFAGISTTNDPGIRVNNATGQLEYRDQNNSAWSTISSLGGGGTTITAGSGLTLSGSALSLGGTITTGTRLNSSGHELMFLDPTSGRIGLGTTSPGYKLDVVGTGSFSGALTLGTQATTTAHAVRADRNLTTGAGLTGGGNLTSDRSLSINSPICAGTDKLQWNGTGFTCSSDTDTTYTAGSGLTLTDTSFSLGGSLAAATDLNLSGHDFTFTGAGNIGIGTTAAGHRLDVAGDINTTGVFRINGNQISTSDVLEGDNLYFTADRARAALSVSAPLTYNSATGLFGITQATTTTSGYLSSTDWNTFNTKENILSFTSGLTRSDQVVTIGGELTQNTRFYTDTAEALFIDFATGQIGLGTTSPSQQLDIAGGIRLGQDANIYNVLNSIPTLSPATSLLYWGDSPLLTEASLAGYGVASISGTPNQIYTSDHTGAVTLSLPQNIDTSASATFANLNLTGALSIGSTNVSQYFVDAAGTLGQVWTSQGEGRGHWTTLTDANNYVTGASITGTSDKTLTLTREGLTDLTAVFSDIGFDNPLTAQGDLLIGGVDGAPMALAGATTDGFVLKYNLTTNTPYWAEDIDTDTDTTYTAGSGLTLTDTSFSLGGSLTAATDLNLSGHDFTFSGAGNVGIGTTAAGAKLDVLGAVRLGLAGGATDLLNTTAAGGAASGALYWGDSALITEASLSTYGVSSLTGTENQITVSASTGAVTLSLPQNIDTSASATFANLNLTGALSIGSTNVSQYFVDAAGTLGQVWTSQGEGRGHWTTLTDANNYVTGASITGTSDKTLTLTREGLTDLTAVFS
jgi:DNA-binding transcriptional MerR regulator